MATPPKLDISALLGQQGVQAELQIKTTESAEERDHRHRKELAEAEHERKKDFYLFIATVGLGLTVSLACLVVLVRPGRDPEDVKWAVPLLTLIFGGFAGRYSGRPPGK
jgi:hypothetical protein